MNKKLLLSSALVSSVALAGAAAAEMKVGGNMEVTYRSYSGDTKAVTDGTVLGQETNITVSGSKDMDNGMTLTYGGNLESDAAGEFNERSMVASTDAFFIGYGRDHGKGIDLDGSVAPHVGDQNDTLAQSTSILFSSNYMDGAYASDHFKLGASVLGGTLSALYAPSLGTNGNDAGNIAANGGDGAEGTGSAYALGYQGSLGVEGLNVQLGIVDSDETASTDSVNQQTTKLGASYTYGQFSVGGDIQDYENGQLITKNGAVGNQAKRVNATFAASDKLAIGVSYTESEVSYGNGTAYSTLSANTAEEITALTVGYNIAGLGFNFSVAEIENEGGVSGTDATTWQIQTKQSF